MLTSQSRPWRYTGRNTPALDALRRITVSLGNERERVVFIGGAIAPLLHTHAILPVVRPTKDVDAIVATATYADFGHLEDALRRSGFRVPDVCRTALQEMGSGQMAMNSTSCPVVITSVRQEVDGTRMR